MQHTIHPFAEEPYYLPQHGLFVAVTKKDAAAKLLGWYKLDSPSTQKIVLLLVLHYRSAVTGSLKGNYMRTLLNIGP